jgi:putative oxidoreductase
MRQFRHYLEYYGPVLARVLLAQAFIVSGIGKFKGFAATAALMGNLGLPAPQLLLVLTLILELGGGVLLILGWQARWLALAFFGFTFLTAVVVHPFWSAEPASFIGQLNNFLKNLAIMGGMLYVAVHGPGPLSLGKDVWSEPAGNAQRKKKRDQDPHNAIRRK